MKQVVAFISDKYLKLQAHNNEAKTGRRNKVASMYFLWKGVQETFRSSETLKDTYATQTLPGNCTVNIVYGCSHKFFCRKMLVFLVHLSSVGPIRKFR